MNQKHLVIIDDNQGFFLGIRAKWAAIEPDHAYWTLNCLILPAGETRKETISALKEGLAALDKSPDHVLVDARLLSTKLSKTLARTVPDACLWMMTGWQDEKTLEDWEAMRELHPHAQALWFDKPLLLEQVLATLEAASRPQENEAASRHWQDIPLPCRLFRADFTPVAVNDLWKVAVDAFPIFFSETDKVWLEQGESLIDEHWGELPDQARHYGLVRYVTQRMPEGQFLQLGISLPKQVHPDRDRALEEIFNLMLNGGAFARARFYEVIEAPGSNGLLRLIRASHIDSSRLPMQHAIGRTMHKRLVEYEAAAIQKGELFSRIRNTELEAPGPGDEDIAFWNLELEIGKAPWLVLPIYRPEPSGLPNKVAGLLLLDRDGNLRAGMDDVVGSEIQPEMVERLKPQLLKTIHFLRKAYQEADVKKKLIHLERLDRWHHILAEKSVQDENTLPDTELSHLETALLKEALDVTKAESAILALRPAGMNYLEVRAQNQEVMRDLCLPLTRERFLAVACANRRESVYVQDYPAQRDTDGITTEDWLDALAHFPEDERKQRARKCGEWIQQDLGSAVALPLAYDDHLLGVLVMRHRDTHHFTATRLSTVEGLLRLAKPFLRRARARAARDAWDTMLVHEQRGPLSDIRNQASFILRPESGVPPKKAAEIIVARADDLVALGDQVMELLGYGDRQGDSYERGRPLELVESMWHQRMAPVREARNKTLKIEGVCPGRPLRDPQSLFPRVLYVLLHNAARHGNDGEIIAIGDALEGQWQLTVNNPGQFPDDVRRKSFTSFTSREDLARGKRRMHIGLAATYRLLEDAGATLELDNSSGGRARATLRWPLELSTALNKEDDHG